MKKTIQVSEEQLKELAIKCCELGQSMNIEPDEFAIQLSMVAKHLCEVHGIQVTSEHRLDG